MSSAKRTPRKTSPKPYHHGDLPRALRQEALRVIQADGVSALTLRGVGERLGVSRTALYRHFANKRALLGAVASDGFVILRSVLVEAWVSHGGGVDGLRAMGDAYVQFAVTHPSHYRVMFGGLVAEGDVDRAVDGKSTDAFEALVDAVRTLQAEQIVRADDPHQMALYIWSVVHGVAMLTLDGVLPGSDAAMRLAKFAHERLISGIGVPASGPAA